MMNGKKTWSEFARGDDHMIFGAVMPLPAITSGITYVPGHSDRGAHDNCHEPRCVDAENLTITIEKLDP